LADEEDGTCALLADDIEERAVGIQAQTDIDLDNEAMYFEIDDMPNAVEWLPAPPDTASTQFVYDITQYIWGKQQRVNADRAQQAIDNAVEEIPEMLEQFSVPFGMELSKENTPAIYHALYRGVLTVRLAASKPKTEYMRKAPIPASTNLHCCLKVKNVCA